MSSKFKIEYYHKMPQASPYLQLLQAKKKIFGYKYELIRSDKPRQHNKSIGHQPSHKHSKTQSHQKEKNKSHKLNSRKKRSQTQQAEERMHQSLFLNREVEKESRHQATKSLFTVQGAVDQSINPHDFVRNYKNTYKDQDHNLKSLTQQVQSKGFSKDRPTRLPSNPLQKLQLVEIDQMIALIESCVQEANDYIGYLSGKIQNLKDESSLMRQQQARIVKLKDGIINEKEKQLDRLRRELHTQKPQSDKTFEIKKLLEIIDKLTQDNTVMRSKLKEFQGVDFQHFKECSEQERKDIYSQIHNKIDILNISIDKKGHPDGAADFDLPRETKKIKSSKNRFYR